MLDIDEEYAHYYQQNDTDDEDNMADYDEDYDEEEIIDESNSGMNNINKYVNQMSSSKFKY